MTIDHQIQSIVQLVLHGCDLCSVNNLMMFHSKDEKRQIDSIDFNYQLHGLALSYLGRLIVSPFIVSQCLFKLLDGGQTPVDFFFY